MKILGREVSENSSILIVAELSANHAGSIELAKETIKAAKKCGADAIKLQTYTADTMTLNSKSESFRIKQGTIWDGKYLYDLYKEAHTPWEWHKDLYLTAREEGLICFSSPFDTSAVDFLEELETPAYKIASFEITDIPLIKHVAAKGKPIIISTGIATFDDIDLAVKTCRDSGNNNIALLKCTSAYPSPLEESNLVMIRDLAEKFKVISGLSDHTKGISAPILSVGYGAKIIEKHFIIDRLTGGPDSSFSLDQNEFKAMVQSVREAEKAVGVIDYSLTKIQKRSRQLCRSLYISEDLKVGEKITVKNLKSVRPGFGLHPKHYELVLGLKAIKDIKKGTPLSFDLLEK